MLTLVVGIPKFSFPSTGPCFPKPFMQNFSNWINVPTLGCLVPLHCIPGPLQCLSHLAPGANSSLSHTPPPTLLEELSSQRWPQTSTPQCLTVLCTHRHHPSPMKSVTAQTLSPVIPAQKGTGWGWRGSESWDQGQAVWESQE